MGIKRFFKRLGGSGGNAGASASVQEGPPERYEGYTIIPAPAPQAGQFLAAGKIVKSSGEDQKEKTFIRADAHSSWDDACVTSINKAKRIIDEQGERLFDAD